MLRYNYVTDGGRITTDQHGDGDREGCDGRGNNRQPRQGRDGCYRLGRVRETWSSLTSSLFVLVLPEPRINLVTIRIVPHQLIHLPSGSFSSAGRSSHHPRPMYSRQLVWLYGTHEISRHSTSITITIAATSKKCQSRGCISRLGKRHVAVSCYYTF